MENKCSDSPASATCITWHLHHLARYECLFDNRFAMGIVSIGGVLTLLRKNPNIISSPRKFPSIFSKSNPAPTFNTISLEPCRFLPLLT